MDEVIPGNWASVLFNSDFICIETQSGYRSGEITDHKGLQIFLKPDATNEAIGLAVLDAMAKSRWVLPAPRPEFDIHPSVEYDLDLFDYKLSALRYAAWVKTMMERFGYKTKRALFKGLEHCLISSQSGVIAITPMRRMGSEGWKGLGPNNAGVLEISAESTPAEIGAALRVAFSRCTNWPAE
jgi:hypothetical protein